MGQSADDKGDTAQRRSSAFWAAVEKHEAKPSRETTQRVRVVANAWPITVTPIVGANAVPATPIEARLVELTTISARFIVPNEIPKNSPVELKILDPISREIVQGTAHVTITTPPPPVATTWIIVVAFDGLTHNYLLRIASWAAQYRDLEIKKKREQTA
jgi:hypothetical protein